MKKIKKHRASRTWIVERINHGERVPAGAEVVSLDGTPHGWYAALTVREEPVQVEEGSE